jgi:hypothetical protein
MLSFQSVIGACVVMSDKTLKKIYAELTILEKQSNLPDMESYDKERITYLQHEYQKIKIFMDYLRQYGKKKKSMPENMNSEIPF